MNTLHYVVLTEIGDCGLLELPRESSSVSKQRYYAAESYGMSLYK